MFAIYLYNHDTWEEGWLKSVKINQGEEYTARYNGKQRFTPSVTEDKSKCKLWKTEKAVVKYAETLRDRLECIMYLPEMQESRRYRHKMLYTIRVYDLDKHLLIHEIRQFAFSSFR